MGVNHKQRLANLGDWFANSMSKPLKTNEPDRRVVSLVGLKPATNRLWAPNPIINGRRRAFATRLGRRDCGPIDMAPPAQAPSRWHWNHGR
jgi:hypothetical protein